jgi:hypothetical protein
LLELRFNGQVLPPTLTVRQAAELAGVGLSAAYDMCRRGKWPVVRATERRIVVCTVPFLKLFGIEVEMLRHDGSWVAKQDLTDEVAGRVKKMGSGALSQK